MNFKDGAGVVIGRFQVPSLHAGHINLLEVASNHQRLIVLVGCHPFGQSKNHPLDYAAREAIGKVSKKGQLALIGDQTSNFETIREDELGNRKNVLVTHFVNGLCNLSENWNNIKERAQV